MSKFTRNDLMELIAWAHAVGANKGKDFGSSHQELMCNILLLSSSIVHSRLSTPASTRLPNLSTARL